MKYDIAFIERLQHHDELAFARFYEESVDDFFRYIMSHYTLSDAEAHDIISDVYVKIRDNIDKYDSNYTFGQFVRTILKNQCKDYFKKSKPVLFSDLQYEIIDTIDRGSASYRDDNFVQELFQFDIDHQILQTTLAALDYADQELIYARYVLDYPYDTIADLYGLTSEAARQKVSRIIKKLHQQLSLASQ